MLPRSLIFIFNISILKEVVNDVKAESALEYAAAINPKIKMIIIGNPSVSLKTTAGKRSSGFKYWISYLPAID